MCSWLFVQAEFIKIWKFETVLLHKGRKKKRAPGSRDFFTTAGYINMTDIAAWVESCFQYGKKTFTAVLWMQEKKQNTSSLIIKGLCDFHWSNLFHEKEGIDLIWACNTYQNVENWRQGVYQSRNIEHSTETQGLSVFTLPGTITTETLFSQGWYYLDLIGISSKIII